MRLRVKGDRPTRGRIGRYVAMQAARLTRNPRRGGEEGSLDQGAWRIPARRTEADLLVATIDGEDIGPELRRRDDLLGGSVAASLGAAIRDTQPRGCPSREVLAAFVDHLAATGALSVPAGDLGAAIDAFADEDDAGWMRACRDCGGTGLRVARSHEDYGVSFESETCERCALGQAILHAEVVEEEARELRAHVEALVAEGRKFADWLERDRREPDKVLCVVQSMRRAFRQRAGVA